MKPFGSDRNSGMIRKFSDWFGINFNPKLLPGILLINIAAIFSVFLYLLMVKKTNEKFTKQIFFILRKIEL